MEYLHTMVRISDVDASLQFFCDGLGLKNVRRYDNEEARFSLIFLASQDDLDRAGLTGAERPLPPGLPMIELTHNWDESVTINRPPRDGHMAFVRSPDNISIELLQKGEHLAPKAPWKDMPNTGQW